jgi:hypothetical protein
MFFIKPFVILYRYKINYLTNLQKLDIDYNFIIKNSLFVSIFIIYSIKIYLKKNQSKYDIKYYLKYIDLNSLIKKIYKKYD